MAAERGRSYGQSTAIRARDRHRGGDGACGGVRAGDTASGRRRQLLQRRPSQPRAHRRRRRLRPRRPRDDSACGSCAERRRNQRRQPRRQPAQPAPAAAGSTNLPQVVLDPAKMPKQFKESPMLAALVKAGKLPPVEQRLPEQPLVLAADQRDRQLRRQLAHGVHRPGRQAEHGTPQPRSPAVLGCQGRDDRAQRGAGLGYPGRRQNHRHQTAQRHEVVRRGAIHRRRHHVLVRGPVPERGPEPVQGGVHGHRRQAGHRRRRSTTTTSPSSSTSPTTCSSTRSPRWPSPGT